MSSAEYWDEPDDFEDPELCDHLDYDIDILGEIEIERQAAYDEYLEEGRQSI